jgi:hypothetical protein
VHPHGQSPKSYSKNSSQSNPFFRTWPFTHPIFEVEPPVTRPQTHPCSISNHLLLDPKHTLARYRTTRSSTPNTPLLDLKHTLARCRTTRYSTSNIPLLDVELPVTRPQTHPCSMSNIAFQTPFCALSKLEHSTQMAHHQPFESKTSHFEPVSLSPRLPVSLSPSPPATPSALTPESPFPTGLPQPPCFDRSGEASFSWQKGEFAQDSTKKPTN